VSTCGLCWDFVIIANSIEEDELPDAAVYDPKVPKWLQSKEGQRILTKRHTEQYRKNCSPIDWFGSFDELANGDSELKHDMCSDFKDEESDSLIAKDRY